MQPQLCYLPDPGKFIVTNGNTRKIVTESQLRAIGDWDINSSIEMARNLPQEWINISYSKQRPKRGPWGMVSYG